MSNSLLLVAESAESAKNFTMYFVLIGTLIGFGILYLSGISLEMVWSLLNTLQLISFLPLMVSFYPEHVKIMFSILEFSNMDIELFSNMFKKLAFIEKIETSAIDNSFSGFGMDSPLFLVN